MTLVRVAQAFVVLIVAAVLFQNCAVGGQEGGALQLGSTKQSGSDTGGWDGSTTTGSSTTGSSTTGSSTSTGTTTGTTCTCPSPSTVACDQPVYNSCGSVCGTGTQGCPLACSSVDSRCRMGGGRFRVNESGSGCGEGFGCNYNGQPLSDCNDCACGTCRE